MEETLDDEEVKIGTQILKKYPLYINLFINLKNNFIFYR